MKYYKGPRGRLSASALRYNKEFRQSREKDLNAFNSTNMIRLRKSERGR